MSVASYLWRYPSALMAWRNLGRNKLRTALAALGIVIGVVSICSLGMATVALQQQANSQLGDIGNEVTLSSGQDSATDGVTPDQVEMMENLAGDAAVVPQKTNSTTLTTRNGQEARMSVTGVTNAAALYNLTSGDAPTRLQSGALISNDTAQTLGLELGDPVEYDGKLYRIEGFIEESGSSFGPGGGGELVLPLSALSDQQYYDTVTIVAADGTEAEEIGTTLDDYFNTDEEEEMSIRTAGNAQQVGGFLDTLSTALLAIGGISLVVASVAILNVMLMSTVERRGEIGVLRAVGIRRIEVLRMILTEATLMGALGGLVGAVASLAAGLVIFNTLTGDPLAALDWSSSQYLVYGFGFAVVASVLSGIYPAWKAANDRPVDALRG
ncbi:ABC transporter permease [Haloferax sp. Atlit-12N]|uniref:ABC transporter permease n=1 Tax=Haloferax sp. Atlit-12N TaxID=2077203 RepID=UPI000E24CE3C|nr:ABC transporter permease [Haloferax sp. Atlit-12N]RDZ64257.1 ABC transporter permease [Haloferax sp. Atlit-12N]